MIPKNVRKKILTIIMITEVLVGIYALVFIASALWNKPLGPGMELNGPVSALAADHTSTPELDVQATQTVSDTSTTSSSLMDYITSFLRPQHARGQTICGGPPVMTLIVVGSDQRDTDYYYGLADSIRLVRIDFTQPGVMAVDIPRDLWVEIPGIADHGVDHGKLNQAFFFGNPGMGFYDGPGEGPGLLARTLDLNYGVQGIDHYLAMDMRTFRNVIDSVGGVDIYLDSYVDLNQGQDGANPDYVYPPGYYHLDGERALMFARLRIPTIFQRARYQDVILRGLQQKLLSPEIIPQLPGLISQFYDSVRTDLSASEISQLVCLSDKLNSDNTRIVAFPDEMFTGGSTYDPYRNVNTYTMSVDIDLMRSYFTDFMNGTWPEN